MSCKNCQEKPVIKLTNAPVSLCKQHFIRYFEKKVLYTIRKFSLIDAKDSIGVALSGGKDSTTLLHLLNELRKKRKFSLAAILIDEGIPGYRDITMKDAIAFCEQQNIPLKILSYKEEFGLTLMEMLSITKQKPCSICGVFRRYLLNKGARQAGFTKLATGHNLDDEAQTILMNQFRRNNETSARLGPLTGVLKDKSFIPRIKPLYLLTEKEVATYAFLKEFPIKFTECPNAKQGYRDDVRKLLNQMELKYPGTKHSIVNTFLETLPYLKQQYSNKSSLQSCKHCNEPTSKEVCQACNLLQEIRARGV